MSGTQPDSVSEGQSLVSEKGEISLHAVKETVSLLHVHDLAARMLAEQRAPKAESETEESEAQKAARIAPFLRQAYDETAQAIQDGLESLRLLYTAEALLKQQTANDSAA